MNKDNVNKILIATAFPIYGAGSGILVSLQTAYHKMFGKEVHIITANNRDDFPKQEGVGYTVVPFTSEVPGSPKLPNAAPFNYLMFTTHTESTENFWNIGLKELEIYNETFEKTLKKEIETFKPDLIHAQHNWLLSSLCTKFNLPVVTTVHGTDLIGYEKSLDYLEKINRDLEANIDFKYYGYIATIFAKPKITYNEIEKAKEEYNKKDLTTEEIVKGELLFNLFENKAKYEYYIEEAENSARKSDRIIIISDAQMEKFHKLFPFAKDNVVLAENGFDERVYHLEESKDTDRDIIDRINQKVDKGIDDGLIDIGSIKNEGKFGNIPKDSDFYGLFVGKFADFKGIDALLMAMKIYSEEIRKQGKVITSIIVGSGKLNDNYLTLHEKLGLSDVKFMGKATPNEIHELQKISSFKFVPSREEPFGLVVPEGCADGIPVIGANSGGIPSILKADKENLPDEDLIRTKLGILFRTLPKRPNNIADAEKDQLLELDLAAAEYIFDNKKEESIAKLIEMFEMTEEEAKEYLESYEKSVRLIAKAALKVLNGEEKFEKKELADYISNKYGQNKKEEQLLNIFNDAYLNHNK